MSTSLRLLSQYNFIEKLSPQDYAYFRKRMIGIVLATDMSRHNKDFNEFKEVLKRKEISDGKNTERLID